MIEWKDTVSTVQEDNRSSSPSSSADEIDLLEIGKTLWRKKLLILGTAAVTSLSAMGVSFLLPKTYTADASILPISGNDAGMALAAGFASQMAPAAGLLGSLGGNGKTAELVEILNSRSMAERVIEKHHLDREIKGWKSKTDLVIRVKKMTTIVSPSLKNKLVSVQVKAPRPELAATMANAYVSELKVMLDEIGYNSAARNRKFIENQLASSKTELTKAENRLSSFQARNQLASLPDTVVASIRSISDLEAQRVGAAVQLKTTEEALSLVQSKVLALQADPSSLHELEIKTKSLAAQESALASAKQTFVDKLTALPPKGMELARLQRDVQVQNAIFLVLSQQLESALINENKESDAFLPLDKAYVPEKPIAPKKALITLFGLLAGIFLGGVAAIAIDPRGLGIRRQNPTA